MNGKPWGPQQVLWGEIKQVQLLMLLLSNLPRGGKLHEVLQGALNVPEEEVSDKLKPCPEISVDGIRAWLSSLWSGEQGPAMQDLITWQLKSENMSGAVKELFETQSKLGFTLSVVRRD